jgi:hypothetical protein
VGPLRWTVGMFTPALWIVEDGSTHMSLECTAFGSPQANPCLKCKERSCAFRIR